MRGAPRPAPGWAWHPQLGWVWVQPVVVGAARPAPRSRRSPGRRRHRRHGAGGALAHALLHVARELLR